MDLDHFLSHEHVRVTRSVALACGDARLATEAVDEAIVRALERIERGGNIVNPAAWITVVAINWTHRRARRRLIDERSQMRIAPLRPSIADTPETEALVDLARALAQLPVRQRQATVLYYLHDLDVSTVARVMDVSEGTVKTALSRSRVALARQLREPSEVPDAR